MTCAYCDDKGELVCCDACNITVHPRCAQPTLRHVPDGPWLCRDCTVDHARDVERWQQRVAAANRRGGRREQLAVRGELATAWDLWDRGLLPKALRQVLCAHGVQSEEVDRVFERIQHRTLLWAVEAQIYYAGRTAAMLKAWKKRTAIPDDVRLGDGKHDGSASGELRQQRARAGLQTMQPSASAWGLRPAGQATAAQTHEAAAICTSPTCTTIDAAARYPRHGGRVPALCGDCKWRERAPVVKREIIRWGHRATRTMACFHQNGVTLPVLAAAVRRGTGRALAHVTRMAAFKRTLQQWARAVSLPVVTKDTATKVVASSIIGHLDGRAVYICRCDSFDGDVAVPDVLCRQCGKLPHMRDRPNPGHFDAATMNGGRCYAAHLARICTAGTCADPTNCTCDAPKFPARCRCPGGRHQHLVPCASCEYTFHPQCHYPAITPAQRRSGEWQCQCCHAEYQGGQRRRVAEERTRVREHAQARDAAREGGGEATNAGASPLTKMLKPAVRFLGIDGARRLAAAARRFGGRCSCNGKGGCPAAPGSTGVFIRAHIQLRQRLEGLEIAKQAAEIATARLRALRRMRGVADAAARCAAAATSVGAQAEGHVRQVEAARRDAAAKETYYWRLRSTIPRNDEEKYFERCLKAAKEGARRTCRRRRPRGA